MKPSRSRPGKHRRGVMAVLSAIMLVVMLGFVAFAVDIGYIGVVRTQLQTAADSAALASAGSSGESEAEMVQIAQQFANANMAAGRHIQLNASDVELGSWDTATNTFIPLPSGQVGTAVKVTVRTSANSGGETALFFGRLLGLSSLAQHASAVATVNPRDIAFVVDLSGSMNDDTTPGSDSANSSLIQNVYDDFGFGTYPGNSQYAGYPLIGSSGSAWLSKLKEELTKDVYKITPYYTGKKKGSKYYDSDGTTVLSDATRRKRTYSWVIEMQLPSANLMPNLIPAADAGVTANYNYWKAYINSKYRSLGYKSYVQFMMDKARDGTAGGSHTPLSLESNLCPCPMHTDPPIGGELFSFPPREMPTHAARRAMIAAIQIIRDRNQSITDEDQKDWVSIITFDSISAETIKWSLSHKDDYAGAMDKCRLLQANGWTGTEAGLDLAYNHIKPKSQGGLGRKHTNKIIVLLTDGMPNDKRDSVSPTSYMNDNPSVWVNPDTGQTINNWVTSGRYVVDKNAALMHTSKMQGDNWNVYAAGVGGGCDYDFMDRMARMGATANSDGESPRGTADPAAYEAVLKDIFEKIITNPKLRLVQ